jgi:hypothetical protein
MIQDSTQTSPVLDFHVPTKKMIVVSSSVFKTISSFQRYQPTFFRAAYTASTKCCSCYCLPIHSISTSTTPDVVLPTRSPTMDTPNTLAPVSSLPVHVQEQSIKAIQKFLNCVAVIDTDPSPLVYGTEANVVEEGTMQIVPVPKATTIDLFAIGREPIKIEENLYWKILEELKQGHVPPIYHALVKGKPCVAFQSNINIMPQSDQVIAGNIPEEIQHHIIGKPAECLLYSNVMWDIGCEGEYLDSAVNAEGVPYPILTDGSAGTWYYDHESAIVAANLVNKSAEMKGYGVEATKLTDSFNIETLCDGDPPPYLITRPKSRGVVMSCFDMKYTSSIVGSPGIGKSYNLLYALQQALLFDGANVVLYVCKTSSSFLLMRRGKTLYTWCRKHSLRDAAYGSLFCRSDVLVLYDPPEAEGGRYGANYSLGRRQLIVAMTADRTHRFKAAQKQTGDSFRFLSPPSLNEMRVMLPAINPLETPDVFWKRLKKIGPLPRYLVNRAKYLRQKSAFDCAISAIRDIYELNELLKTDGWVVQQYTFPETLLAVAGARLDKVDGQVIPENYEDYEGEHINYKEQIVMALNCRVIDAVGAPGLDVVLSNAWNLYDTDRVPLKDILGKRSKTPAVQKRNKKKSV